MGRQLQLATTQPDEVQLLRFIRTLAPIRVFQPFAPSRKALWLDDWETREIPSQLFRIWPQTFAWSPEYAQTGGPNCRPEHAGQFYIADAHTAPVLEFSRSFLDQQSCGRIYWARGFSAPHGLAYDDGAFARFTDAVWRWIRKVGRRLPDTKRHSQYFLPDAWSRYGHSYIAAEKKAQAGWDKQKRNYCIKVIRANIVKNAG